MAEKKIDWLTEGNWFQRTLSIMGYSLIATGLLWGVYLVFAIFAFAITG